MDLYFVGTHHFDPMGRVWLKQWLELIKTNHDHDPAFIAVEFVEELYQNIKSQREKYKSLFVGEMSLRENVLNDVVLSLGYGGDCHQELFPNVFTVWLNNFRPE